jgi:hypothetical protein
MVDFTPKGKVSVKKTLTKMGSIAKSQKKPSIKIMPSKDGKVHVVPGKQVSVAELKESMKKVKEMEAKNKGHDIFAKKDSFATRVKKYARDLVLDKKELKQLPPLSEVAKWEDKKLYGDLKKAHKLMDDTNPVGWKASIEGLAEMKDKLSKSNRIAQDYEILVHNVKYFQNLVRKNKALLTKDFGQTLKIDANQNRLSPPISSTTWDRMTEEEKKTMEQEAVRPVPESTLLEYLKKFPMLEVRDIEYIVQNNVSEKDTKQINDLRNKIQESLEHKYSGNKRYHEYDITIREILKKLVTGNKDTLNLSKWKLLSKDEISNGGKGIDFAQYGSALTEENFEKKQKLLEKIKEEPKPEPKVEMGILQKRRAERKEKEKQEQERTMMEKEDVPAPKPAPKTKPKPVPEQPSILATKKFLKELEYLKKEDIDFILKNGLYEDTANDINSLRSMISYYIESSQIKEEVIDSVKDLMERSKRDSPNFVEWKNFMRKPIMNTITALKIPTRKELIRKNYAEITLEDIDFIVEHDLEHDDISKMDMVRYKQKLEKAYKLPKFDTKAERIAYMEDEPARKIKRIKEIVKPEPDDSPILKKWKIAQFVFMTT